MQSIHGYIMVRRIELVKADPSIRLEVKCDRYFMGRRRPISCCRVDVDRSRRTACVEIPVKTSKGEFAPCPQRVGIGQLASRGLELILPAALTAEVRL